MSINITILQYLQKRFSYSCINESTEFWQKKLLILRGSPVYIIYEGFTEVSTVETIHQGPRKESPHGVPKLLMKTFSGEPHSVNCLSWLYLKEVSDRKFQPEESLSLPTEVRFVVWVDISSFPVMIIFFFCKVFRSSHKWKRDFRGMGSYLLLTQEQLCLHICISLPSLSPFPLSTIIVSRSRVSGTPDTYMSYISVSVGKWIREQNKLSDKTIWPSSNVIRWYNFQDKFNV